MDQKTVRKLENEIEQAIADIVVVRNKKWKYPLMPSRQTMHLMAKAATAVYKAAVENDEGAQQD